MSGGETWKTNQKAEAVAYGCGGENKIGIKVIPCGMVNLYVLNPHCFNFISYIEFSVLFIWL